MWFVFLWVPTQNIKNKHHKSYNWIKTLPPPAPHPSHTLIYDWIRLHSLSQTICLDCNILPPQNHQHCSISGWTDNRDFPSNSPPKNPRNQMRDSKSMTSLLSLLPTPSARLAVPREHFPGLSQACKHTFPYLLLTASLLVDCERFSCCLLPQMGYCVLWLRTFASTQTGNLNSPVTFSPSLWSCLREA